LVKSTTLISGGGGGNSDNSEASFPPDSIFCEFVEMLAETH